MRSMFSPGQKDVIMSDMDPSADWPWTLEAVQQLGSWRARVFLCR